MTTLVDVVVIGAGQAGLSAAHHLLRRGLVPLERASTQRAQSTLVVLDAEDGPGGAWQHRWPSLTMSSVNGIHELPDFPVPQPDPAAPAREVLPAYFGDYERRLRLAVRRPVRVSAVHRADERLRVETEHGAYAARAVVNATGTWTRPFLPTVPGMSEFRGRILHTAQYSDARDFTGQRVAIVGAGVSAVQLLDEISALTETIWFTRRPVAFSDEPFDEPTRIAVIGRIAERTAAGLPPESVVRATGLYWSPWARSAHERGALQAHPMFTSIEAHGVRSPSGGFERVDAILFATGFRAALGHLRPLHLRLPGGGLRVDDSRSLDEPRLFLIGYGPSASTIGANRAGRRVARAITQDILLPGT